MGAQPAAWCGAGALLVLLAACQGSPVAALRACENLACQRARLAAAWDEDPDATVALVASLPDDVAQTTLAEDLALRSDRDLGGICDRIPPARVARSRCDRLRWRPHLTLPHPDAGPPPGVDPPAPSTRPAAGPDRDQPDLPIPTADLPWAADPFLPPPETPTWPDDPAAFRGTVALAAAGLADEAGMACRTHFPDRGPGLDECLFRAAEAAAVGPEGGPGAVTAMLRLCAASGFRGPCVAHGIELAGPPAPPADAPGLDRVSEAVAWARTLGAAVPAPADGVAPPVDLFWSLWTGAAFQQADVVRGDLVPLLPPEALPHLRFGAALRLLRDEDLTRGFDPFRIATEVGRVLQEALPAPATSPRAAPISPPDLPMTWQRDLPGEETIPATFRFGAGRRPTSPDPETDLLLTVLEASACVERHPPPAWYLSFAGTPLAEEVRWTAVRLGRALDAARGPVFGRRDPGPRVQARLDAPGEAPPDRR